MTTMVHDTRPIKSAWAYFERSQVGAAVGTNGVTRIEAYLESGQMAYVTWLQVWKGDVLAMRINCAHMTEINYAEVPTDANAV